MRSTLDTESMNNDPKAGVPAAGTRVLVVDDEPALLEAVRIALDRAGCVVTASRTYEDARERLLADSFDVLITDVRLGAFNGIQLAVIARSKAEGMKIVVFSGFDDPVLRAEAASLEATYLVKPISAEQLLQQIAAT